MSVADLIKSWTRKGAESEETALGEVLNSATSPANKTCQIHKDKREAYSTRHW